MNLCGLVKLDYGMMIINLILIFWTSMIQTHELPVEYPPCYFNPLCTCSKAIPDLGIVNCDNVPMPMIPHPINSSKVFMLQLGNNGLRHIQPQFLMNTGLYNLQIRYNPLSDIPDEAFLGLERSLWELELPYNKLVRVPSRSFRHLQKLKLLDLTGNQISSISADNWRGLENSLHYLRLGKNTIDRLPADAFSGLTVLEILDLRDNDLWEIDSSVFRDGIPHLTHLYLNGNQLTSIPYSQVSNLKRIKVLDLSYNRIYKMTHIQNEAEIRGLQISLDTLRLDWNQIEILTAGSFQHFFNVNKTYLSGNPLTIVEEGTFKNSKIRELYFIDCDLTEMTSSNLKGLEFSLELLDLSGNNITDLPNNIFQEFDFLRTLNFRENKITKISPVKVFASFQYSLYNIDLSGKINGIISLQDLRHMRNLRYLSLSKLSQTTLGPDDFNEFGMDIKELHIIQSNINEIKNHAFTNVRGIKYLNFAENSISTIENEAFSEVGHSLQILKLAHALSMNEIPSKSFKDLTNLQYLDMSNNKIRTMPDNSFHFLKRIKKIELQDNEISEIKKGTFQGDIHSTLEEIDFSFNRISNLQIHTFVDLSSMSLINLADNNIENINRRAFMNMNRLKYINLRGNKIKLIADESFQNLPDLEFLDLSYNKLTEFDFGWFDQVGTLSSFKVNSSHNSIIKLKIELSTLSTPNSMYFTSGGIIQSNIRVLDLSHNNITEIDKFYFRPVEYSLTHLYLSNNQLTNMTQLIFGNLAHLQWLDLRFNDIMEIDYDCFKNTNNIQLLLLSHNNIMDIPSESFRILKKLRILDLSYNKLRALPDNMFSDIYLESLDLSHNQFMRLPTKTLFGSASQSLAYLNIAWNLISGVHTTDAISRLRSLIYLDLSYNRLVRLDDGVFSELKNLNYLDLSHNKQLILETRGRTFHGLEDTLLILGLSNISLLSVPELPFHNLRHLYLASNELATIPAELASNLSSLHELDLSHNDLTVVPLITHTLFELKKFNLAYNPITIITNTSFLGPADSLVELDIRKLPLIIFESGAICKAGKLRTLSITAYTDIKNFNLPNLLEHNHGLRNLLIDIHNDTNLERQMKGLFPTKLFNFTFTGKKFNTIDKYILKGMKSPHLHFTLYNTSVKKISSDIFLIPKTVRNITIYLNNNELSTLENPSNGYKPGVEDKKFLMGLIMAGSHVQCDCNIGWIEGWQRKQRQYREDRCSNFPHRRYNFEIDEDNEYSCWDNGWDDDLREAFCSNKNNIPVLNALKDDIECGWSTASTNKFNYKFIIYIFSLIIIHI
ncbi:chaoptin-like [Aphidius gifuensis]|uniref:chaoptin-like n=1 Tax=Aphidius gifuensis TaxID=684658 RepID=UPI001CDB64CF|nr:chaoptin-like [Aphidius gifuensis]